MTCRRFLAMLILFTMSLPLAAVSAAGASSPVLHAAVIVYGEAASAPERHAAAELARDLARTRGVKTRVLSDADWDSRRNDEALFLVGTPDTFGRIREQARKLRVSAADPGPEAFVLHAAPDRAEVVIAGCDARGTLYGVYEYSRRVLGVDPMEFWTGKEPPKQDGIAVAPLDYRERPPAFPLRGYFDNDSDMLANWQGKKLIVEFETWKEMIDSLARLRYNFIDLFDTLGRTEFWVWPYYRERFPGYRTDLDLVNRIIDYAHEKGMMVQVQTYLGYQFSHLDYNDKCLLRHHDDWMAGYRDLIENTPIGRADLFLHSPRDPWWDRPYRCGYEAALGIDAGALHTRVINELQGLIAAHNPKALLLCSLWSDGKKHWDGSSFKPDRSIPMVWSDDGYGRYPSWPPDFKGHEFGIYIHAGYWRNHVIQDPYPDRIAASLREAQSRGLSRYVNVNGQDFKHFILNLEAAGRAAWDPDAFDPNAFYDEWTGRYFGPAGPTARRSLEALHQAHDLVSGGFAHLTMVTKIVLKTAGFGVPYIDRMTAAQAEAGLVAARRSLELATAAREQVPAEARLVFDDQIYFPAKIFLANLELNAAVLGLAEGRQVLMNPLVSLGKKFAAWRARPGQKKQATESLDRLLKLLEAGSGWDKWDGWTKVENFRKYEPPPTREELAAALKKM